MKHIVTTAAALAAFSAPAFANEYEPAMQEFLDSSIMEWSSAQVLIDAINERNAMTSAYGQDEIDALDTTWRNEVGSSDSETIKSVLDNAAADFLRMQVEQSGGVITEVFIMDAQGLNVAASALTSDYWQGDEAKHQETYGVGANAVHFGEVEFDDSSQSYQGQISMTVTDPETGQPIGALTVGVNAESLF